MRRWDQKSCKPKTDEAKQEELGQHLEVNYNTQDNESLYSKFLDNELVAYYSVFLKMGGLGC